MAQSDDYLIKEILKGNESAMELLINRYYDLIFSYNYRSLGDYHVAYDLTQEVFIKMIKNIKNFKVKEDKFKNWLVKIAVNNLRDYVKSSYYKKRNSCEDVSTLQFEDEKEINVLNLLEINEERLRVKGAVDKLSSKQKEIILLRFYHELKISEISTITGVNENTVKSRLRDGLKKLKTYLLWEVARDEEENCIK